MEDLRDQTEQLKELNRDLALKGGKERILFHLFWHNGIENVLDKISPEVLIYMYLKGDKHADRQHAELKAREIIMSFHSAKLVDLEYSEVLTSPLVLTEEGKRFVQKNNRPEKPIVIFFKEILAHKAVVLATIIGIISGSIAIYEVIRRLIVSL